MFQGAWKKLRGCPGYSCLTQHLVTPTTNVMCLAPLSVGLNTLREDINTFNGSSSDHEYKCLGGTREYLLTLYRICIGDTLTQPWNRKVFTLFNIEQEKWLLIQK